MKKSHKSQHYQATKLSGLKAKKFHYHNKNKTTHEIYYIAIKVTLTFFKVELFWGDKLKNNLLS